MNDITNNLLTLQDEDGQTYNINLSNEDYQKIISGDYDLANKYLQREIERKNRLLAYQLVLQNKKEASCSSFGSKIQSSSKKCVVEETDDTLDVSNAINVLENDDVNAFSQRWTNSETKRLINNFEKVNDKKYRTKSIYLEIAKHFDRFSAEQVESKIKNLKKTYKTILDNNNNSGRGKITWPYFDTLQEIFGNKPENSPLSIASNRLGFVENSPENIGSELEIEAPTKKIKVNNAGTSDSDTSSVKKMQSGNKAGISTQSEWVKEFRAEMSTRHKEKCRSSKNF